MSFCSISAPLQTRHEIYKNDSITLKRCTSEYSTHSFQRCSSLSVFHFSFSVSLKYYKYHYKIFEGL